MREILFRGKRTDNGEWVYGRLLADDVIVPIGQPFEFEVNTGFICSDLKCYDVDPSTVGQYTGLTDKNGKSIFEGDIVKNDWCFVVGYSVVKFGQYKTFDMKQEYQQGHLGFYLEHINERKKRIIRKDLMYFANKCEVIGNIHDNPELLEGGNNE